MTNIPEENPDRKIPHRESSFTSLSSSEAGDSSMNMAKIQTRRVSFPSSDKQLVTGYLEPPNPWALVEVISPDELQAIYKKSCKKHNTDPIPCVIDHIKNLTPTAKRCKLLSLSGIALNPSMCESLEDIFKHVQYIRVELAGCGLTDDTAVTLFDMFEYYDTVVELDISENVRMGLRAWQSCCKLLKSSNCLQVLEARFSELHETYMMAICKALREGSSLYTLKLEHCGLSGRGIVALVTALKVNGSLRELWIANNDLTQVDAAQLSSLLRVNLLIQLLDVSNNCLQDPGAEYLLDAIIEQTNHANAQRATRRAQSEEASTSGENIFPLEDDELNELYDESSITSMPGIIVPTGQKQEDESSDDVVTTSTDQSALVKTHTDMLSMPGRSQGPPTPQSIIKKASIFSSNYVQLLRTEFDENEPEEKFSVVAKPSLSDTTISSHVSAPNVYGTGLAVLIMWNNRLTRSSSPHLKRALETNESLEILNIGQNLMSNEILTDINPVLKKNTSLLSLGMQTTHLTCEGIIILADTLLSNKTLRRIDLRDNNIQLAGIKALTEAMKFNRFIIQLDLDEKPRRVPDDGVTMVAEYEKCLQEIREYCQRNKELCPDVFGFNPRPASPLPYRGRLYSTRKISLTCQTIITPTLLNRSLLEPRKGGRLRSPLPSPIPSPISSPVPSPSRHRFHVSRVNETSKTNQPNLGSSPLTPPSLSSSPTRFFPSAGTRFRVTIIEPNSNPQSVKTNSLLATVGFSCEDGKTSQTKIITSVSPQQVADDSMKEETFSEIVENLNIEEKNVDPMGIPISNLDISDTTKYISDRSPIERSINESLDSPDMEVSRYMNNNRAIFGSTSSLEASTSSMESISMESIRRNLPMKDLNISVSSNDSFDMDKPSGISSSFENNDCVRIQSFKMSVSSFDSSGISTNEINNLSINSEYLKDSSYNLNASTSSQNLLENQIIRKTNGTSKSTLSLIDQSVNNSVLLNSNQNTLTSINNECLEMNAPLDPKQRHRKTSWVSPINNWLLDDISIRQDNKLPISKSESKLSPRNTPPKLDEKSKSEEGRIPSSLDKLLSLFQHPGSFFTRSTPSESLLRISENQKKDNNIQFTSFYNWATGQGQGEVKSKLGDIAGHSDISSSISGSSVIQMNEQDIVCADSSNTIIDNSTCGESTKQNKDVKQPENEEDYCSNISDKENNIKLYSDSVKQNITKQNPLEYRNDLILHGNTNQTDIIKKLETSLDQENKNSVEELYVNQKLKILSPNISPDNTIDRQTITLVDNLPNKIIEGIKENISPENTIVSNFKLKTCQILETVEKQGTVIERISNLVEPMSICEENEADNLELLKNEFHNDFNDKIKESLDVDCVKASDTNEIDQQSLEKRNLGEITRDSIYSSDSFIENTFTSQESLKSLESIAEDVFGEPKEVQKS